MSIAPSFVTPLRYPGGKGRLGAWLAEIVRHNNLGGSTYIEPYAGGAGAAVFLLLNNHVEKIVINDIDPAIYAFWWAVFNDSERLVRCILETSVDLESWARQREIMDLCDLENKAELGFATFFLNRTNRSGIIQGGVIGGKSQLGKYKIDARYNKLGLISRINNLASMSERVSVCNLDAIKLLDQEACSGEKTLIYLDPPYYNKGDQLYKNYYMPEDHRHISEVVSELGSPWIVTYDNCQEIRDLYEGENQVEFSFHYSTHLARPMAKEIMFYGNLELHALPTMRR